MKNNKLKDNPILIILTLVLLVLFCIAAVITRAIDFFDMPASFLGAALGAVITAVVTQLLLKGQAKTAEETERNVRVFELKKNVFTEYINKVWQIWSDQRIDDNEFEELCSFYYKDVSMYLKDPETRKEFVDCLINIGDCLGKGTDENYKNIKNNIFGIINILVKDLGLGGSVDEEQHERLTKKLLPGFFKKVIEKEIFNVMQGMSKSFLPGRYEPFYYDNNEYLCFYCDTEKTAGVNFAKIIIGPLKEFRENDGQKEWINGDIGVYFCADINWNGWRPDENMPYLGDYKAGKAGEWYRIIKTKGIIKDSNITCPIKRANDKEPEDKGVYRINFGKTDELADKYSVNYPDIARVLAKRVGIFFDEEKIDLKNLEGNPTGEAVSIIEFMRLYKLIE